MPQPLIIIARFAAPMDGAVMEGAGVVVDGERIVAVGMRGELDRRFPDAPVLDLGEAVILPGLINAHAHLELSHLARPMPAPATLVPWLMQVMASSGAGEDAERIAANSARNGAMASLEFGVTVVADITRHPRATRSVLRGGPGRVISFGEVTAMGPRRGFLEERIARAVDESQVTGHVSIGISPHAPYSIEVEGYRRCIEEAKRLGLAVMTHLAESADEAAFLAAQTGPFRELWESIGGLDERVPRFEGGAIRFARLVGLLDHCPALLAHVNYCDDEEMMILAEGKASVVYCPRTHAYFGHPPHRWREMLGRGINVAVGTDSTASSPDLNLVEEIRLLHADVPEVPAAELWRLITARAAGALGIEAEAGTLAAGKRADLAVFPCEGADPLEGVLRSGVRPVQVWAAGKRVV